MAEEIDDGEPVITPQMIEAGRDAIADMHLGLMGLEAGEEERLLVAVFRAMIVEGVRSERGDLLRQAVKLPLVSS